MVQGSHGRRGRADAGMNARPCRDRRRMACSDASLACAVLSQGPTEACVSSQEACPSAAAKNFRIASASSTGMPAFSCLSSNGPIQCCRQNAASAVWALAVHAVQVGDWDDVVDDDVHVHVLKLALGIGKWRSASASAFAAALAGNDFQQARENEGLRDLQISSISTPCAGRPPWGIGAPRHARENEVVAKWPGFDVIWLSQAAWLRHRGLNES